MQMDCPQMKYAVKYKIKFSNCKKSASALVIDVQTGGASTEIKETQLAYRRIDVDLSQGEGSKFASR
jgi:hypothetical protein